MIQIEKFIFNPFQVNCYVLFDETRESIIIDPACYFKNENSQLADFIKNKALTLKRVFYTHAHIDHICGNQFIFDNYNIKAEAHKADEFLLKIAVMHGQIFGFNIKEPLDFYQYLNEGDQIEFGNSTLSIIHVPGHSPGSIVFHSPQQKFIVCGDVLFKGSIGRSDLEGGNGDLLLDGIKNKLMTLNDDTIVYSGHGQDTTIGHERRNNYYLLKL